ncbi:MAG: outer membrane beta-barrel protein [Gemmatimonadetes bacterium]|nr:outer membrane beta-barrel protein [Gemmatimonadota bacterium]
MALVAAASLAAAALPTEVAAQDEMAASVTLVAGVFQYDLEGTGAVPFGGVRLPLPMHRWIVLEPAITYAAYESQGGDNIPLLTPEVQVQGRLDLGRVDPFLGLGIGGTFDLRENRGGEELVVSTYSVGAGARGWLGRGWSLRGELRVRGIDGFTGSAAEWTVGVGRTF